MKPYYEDDHVTLWHGDCIEALAAMLDASVDAIVTDPPYGLEFMGKEWDAPWKASSIGRGVRVEQERAAEMTPTGAGHSTSGGPYLASRVDSVRVAGLPFQQWCESWARECLRVLKPGGLIAAFGGTRTFHRLTCAIEDAGFEIRDSIGYGTEERPGLMAWVYGSGFPKSLNVTKALEGLPACSCGVASLSGEPAPVVEASVPASSVGARAGTEASAMGSARGAADEAVGVGPQVVASRAPDGGVSDVDALDIDGIGQALPVVLRASSVAGATQGQEVVGLVGDVKVNPEALRDQVMGEQSVGPTTVGAPSVTLDGGGCDVHPSSPLVFPLAASPRGIADAVEPVAVVGGHAGAGAVGAGVCPAAELIATEDTDVDSVSLTLHASHSTPERMVRCEACGGVRGKIPQGLGTALKPGWEPIVVARKPLAGTVAANVLEHGTGALNIDGCRVEGEAQPFGNGTKRTAGIMGDSEPRGQWSPTAAGRWPANVVLDESQAAALDEQSGETVSREGKRNAPKGAGTYGAFAGDDPDRLGHADSGGASRFFLVCKGDTMDACGNASTAEPSSSQQSARGDSAPSDAATSASLADNSSSRSTEPSTSATATESRPRSASDTQAILSTAPRCSPESRQPRHTPTSSPARNAEPSEPTDTTTTTQSRSKSAGSAAPATFSTTPKQAERGVRALPLDALNSRFTYTAKAPSAERPKAGKIAHPTVKPLDLMRWLVRLVTPPGGVVLDPFAGSGTTLEAAIVEGFRCIGIEREADYLPLIDQRIARACPPLDFTEATA